VQLRLTIPLKPPVPSTETVAVLDPPTSEIEIGPFALFVRDIPGISIGGVTLTCIPIACSVPDELVPRTCTAIDWAVAPSARETVKAAVANDPLGTVADEFTLHEMPLGARQVRYTMPSKPPIDCMFKELPALPSAAADNLLDEL
jgi:hypothetical protein